VSVPKLIVQGAQLKCSIGIAPSTFSVSPSHDVAGDARERQQRRRLYPDANVASLGMCQSMSNPQVSAATSAALGVLTPQPCQPVLAQAWSPGSTSVTAADRPALHDGCTCACQWGRTISVTSAAPEGGAN
jgi:hypothetical protein